MATEPSNKNIKVYAVVAAILVVAGLFLLLNQAKAAKVKKMLNEPDSLPDSPASKPVKATSPTSTFPIRIGSAKNALVTQLQTLLGVTADGLFGPKTSAALALQTGKAQINNQAEYDALVTKLQNTTAITANRARGNDIVARWKSNTALQLTTITKSYFTGVSQDAYGALNPNGKNQVINANYKLNRNDYTPQGVSTAGFLVFSINNGEAKGLYKTDVNNMTLS